MKTRVRIYRRVWEDEKEGKNDLITISKIKIVKNKNKN